MLNTIFSVLCVVLALFPVVALLCTSINGITFNAPDRRKWYQVVGDFLLNLAAFATIGAVLWLLWYMAHMNDH